MNYLLALLLFLSPLFAKDIALVSLYPFYTLLEGMVKNRFEPQVLLPPNVDYHLYELSPRDILKIERARVVFVSGIPVGGWEKKVEEIAKGKAVTLFKSENLSVKDTHPWLSPHRMRFALETMFKTLSSIDPAGGETYKKNYTELKNRLERLDRLYKRTLSRCRRRTIPVVHPSLGYLVQDYGLKELSLLHGDAHGGISPSSLIEFTQKIEKEGLDFIFDLYLSPSKAAQLLKKERGIKVYPLNVKIIPTESAKDYFSIMEENLKIIKDALECR